jgi:hypothetical protein
MLDEYGEQRRDQQGEQKEQANRAGAAKPSWSLAWSALDLLRPGRWLLSHTYGWQAIWLPSRNRVNLGDGITRIADRRSTYQAAPTRQRRRIQTRAAGTTVARHGLNLLVTLSAAERS